MIESQVELYTDGSCQRNPGAGGLAFIIKYFETAEGSDFPQKKEIGESEGYRLTTNNRMEIWAAVKGMQKILGLCQVEQNWSSVTQVNLRSDSEYFCKAINQRWLDKWKEHHWMTSGYQGMKPKPVKNKDLWEQVIQCQEELRKRNINLTVEWVKGHNGDEYNEKCDQLATEAAASYNTHLIDTEYEKTTTVYNRR